MQKRGLNVKKKKSQDMGGFVNTSCEDRDKELSKWDESDQGQDLHPRQPAKNQKST